MGTTPIYALPWPEQADIPDGPNQIKAAMQATETALGTIRATPIQSTVTAAGVDQSALTTGQVTLQWTAWTQMGTVFLTTGLTSWRWTVSGLYEISARVRGSYTGASLPAGGYLTLAQAGAWGTTRAAVQLYSSLICDAEFRLVIHITAAMLNVDCSLFAASSIGGTDTWAIVGSRTQLSIRRLGAGSLIT